MSHLKLTSQLRRFLITGLSATAVDATVYSILLYLGLDYSPAKAGGFLTAVAFAYNGHRRWTFSTHGSKKRIVGFAGLYVTTFLINNLTNTLMLELLGTEYKTQVAAAFVVATGVTAIVNFTMMKFFIFRPAKPIIAEEQ